MFLRFRHLYQERCPQALAHHDMIYTREEQEFERAGGDVVCDICGTVYYGHPSHPHYRDLTILCSGEVVKL